jgi:hypothetical protein
MLAGGGDEHQLVATLAVPLDAGQPLGVEALPQHLFGKAGAEESSHWRVLPASGCRVKAMYWCMSILP